MHDALWPSIRDSLFELCSACEAMPLIFMNGPRVHSGCYRFARETMGAGKKAMSLIFEADETYRPGS